jgi:chorismate mutase
MALRREQVLTTQAAKDYNDLLNERRQLMDDIGKAGFQSARSARDPRIRRG